MARIQDLQNKANSLSDAREFCDLDNPGAALERPTFLIKKTTILSPRTMPRCDSRLPRNGQNCTCIMGNVLERPLAQEGLCSTILSNSKNSASSPQESRPDATGSTRRRESEMK